MVMVVLDPGFWIVVGVGVVLGATLFYVVRRRARSVEKRDALDGASAAEVVREKAAAKGAPSAVSEPILPTEIAPSSPPPIAAAAPAIEVESQAAGAVAPSSAPASTGPFDAAAVIAPPSKFRLRERLAKTSQALVGRIEALLGGRQVDDALLGELEALLFTADLGVQTAQGILDQVRREARGLAATAVKDVLRKAIAEKLARVQLAEDPVLHSPHKPHVILVLGVNGSGKTTTIGKLAAHYTKMGKKVVLGAGDTFRAAATEQLQVWGERTGCEVVVGREGGDPSSVAFDAVKRAVAVGADLAIIDTAGRLQTREPLIEELKKIVRVTGKALAGAPHETLLVLDSNTGQNALSQARVFTQAAGVTGIVLTKLDGTAKGGVIVGLADEFGIPVRNVGVGEAVEDLREFCADEFVAALFET